MHNSVAEFSVKTLEIGGLGSALTALRLPFGLEPRSGVITRIENHETIPEALRYRTELYMDSRDTALIRTLVNRGDEHAKVLRGMVVWCEINAPRYWWVEMDTYRVGAERLASESTMHIQGRGKSQNELVEMKEHLEEGTMQRRVWMFSYQTLRRIYYQRIAHRLPQWKKFCDWIETLPFAKEFIIGDEGDNPYKSISDSDN